MSRRSQLVIDAGGRRAAVAIGRGAAPTNRPGWHRASRGSATSTVLTVAPPIVTVASSDGAWHPRDAPTRPAIILDCDPGHDDAIALVVAARHTDLLGITTVAGNAPLESTTRNAIVMRDLLGIDVPVHCGRRAAAGRPTAARWRTSTARAGSTAPTCREPSGRRRAPTRSGSSSTRAAANDGVVAGADRAADQHRAGAARSRPTSRSRSPASR